MPSHIEVRAHVAGHVSLNSSGAAFLIEIGAKFPIGPNTELVWQSSNMLRWARTDAREFWAIQRMARLALGPGERQCRVHDR